MIKPTDPIPRFSDALLFRIKATGLRAQRRVHELQTGRPKRLKIRQSLTTANVIAESRTALWTKEDQKERSLVTGKIQNLRIAIRNLNGIEVGSNQVFSFWRQIGRASRRRGYVLGRELREGCLIPTLGGGLCQLSNALYDAALQAGFEIVERHAHTRVIPGSLAEAGRDATVFWNYVDLRFKSPRAFRIEIELTSDFLIVRLRGTRTTNRVKVSPISTVSHNPEIGSCFSCGENSCFRAFPSRREARGQTAYLLDEYWAEYDRYISSAKQAEDTLLIPLDGRRFGKSNYAWNTSGFRQVEQSIHLTLLRASRTRRLSTQSAARQRALMSANEHLALYFAARLTHEQTHLVVMQNLLPYLWRDGHLGGRTFDVLMTGLPLRVLQHRLNQALRMHPESPTLGDFRADDLVVDDEAKALARARKIVTPHSEIASLFPDRAIHIDWIVPHPSQTASRTGSSFRLAFPAATLGRKGVYELREVLRNLDAELLVNGPVLEKRDFWKGLRVVNCAGNDWLSNATAVVLPSFVECKPRKVLQAVAHGLPVVATHACGLANVSGVTNVRTGDVNDLRAALERFDHRK